MNIECLLMVSPAAVPHRLRSLPGSQEEEVWIQARASSFRSHARLPDRHQQGCAGVHKDQRVREV